VVIGQMDKITVYDNVVYDMWTCRRIANVEVINDKPSQSAPEMKMTKLSKKTLNQIRKEIKLKKQKRKIEYGGSK
jgi:hypothetical protein